MDDLGVGKQLSRIGRAPHGVGADLEALAALAPEILQRKARPQHQRIARRIARKRRADHEARRVLVARHVLQRMHRRLQFAGQHGGADLCDKGTALAAMRQQLAGLVGIAGGLEFHDLDGEPRRGAHELPRDLVGLGERHDALARAYP